TEAVTYISGRSVSLMSVFYLGALVAAGSDRRWLHFSVAPLGFAAALLVNETAWTLPFALLLLNFARSLPLRDNLLRVAPLLATTIAVVVLLALTPTYSRLLQHSLSLRPLAENLGLQVEGWFYLMTQPLLLLRTNIDPDLPAVALYSLSWCLQLAVLVIVATVALRWRRQMLGIGLLWFLLHLLPTISLLARNDIANDRQLYLALLGPAWVLAHTFVTVLSQRLLMPFAALLLFSLGATTAVRNRDYRDEIQLWQATAQRSPNKARVWSNLGYVYQLAGLRAQASGAYQRALRLDPALERARINLQLLDPPQ